MQQIWQRIGVNGVAVGIGMDYWPSGLPRGRYNPNGTNTFTGFDARGRVIRIGHWDVSTGGVGTEQEVLAYTYDNARNILSYANTTNRYGAWNTTCWYDRADRMTRETRTGGTATTNFLIGYAYDKNNNRVGTSRNGAYSGYTYTTNDRFVSGDGILFNSYDNDGNPGNVYFVDGSSLGLAYNIRSQLRQLWYSSGGSNTFWYNGDGKRVERNDSTGTTRYVYNLNGDVIGEADINKSMTRYHIPGLSLTESNGNRYYYRENALGSQVAMTGERNSAPGQGDNNNQLARTEYDAYGKEQVLAMTADKRGDFRFAGKHGYVTDTQSGMQLLGARYYLPALGRFLTQDPIGHEGGLNLYAYCSNNPLSKVDPDGTQEFVLFRQDIIQSVPASTKIGYGWSYGLGVFGNWLAGWGADRRNYNSSSFQAKQMQDSAAGAHIRQWAKEHNYRSGAGDSVNTLSGFWLTLSDGFTNGTEAQVGGFGFRIQRNPKNNYYTVYIDNVVSFNSFWGHAPSVVTRVVAPGLWDGTYDRAPNGFGPMGNIYQGYHYNEPIK